nr:hypothetical protein [Tanacetum cinerariifolium]
MICRALSELTFGRGEEMIFMDLKTKEKRAGLLCGDKQGWGKGFTWWLKGVENTCDVARKQWREKDGSATQYKPEDVQELFCELFNDVQNVHEELAEYINTLGWNCPTLYNSGDDDEEDCTIAITPDFLITDSLIMGDEHLDTIPEKESNEFNKSCVEDLVPNPREFKDECECDVPDCDDSQTKNFSTFSNPLFDGSTSSDDESSHEEVIHEISFKTYSNPFFDLDKEIISSEFNPIHNEDLDSTPKNDHFDTKSYLLESLLNCDESIPPGIDSDDSDSEGDNLFLERLLDDDPIPLPDNLDFSNVI